MRQIDNKLLYKGFFTINQQIVQKSDGTTFPLEVLERGNAIAAIVKDIDTNKYIFVRQYRVCNSDYLIEIPAGMVDKNEDFKEAVARELKEEIGYGIEHICQIAEYYSSPGTSTEKVHLFHVEGRKLTSGGGLKDENEEIEIIELTEEELKVWQFQDSKTIIGVNYVLNLPF